MRRYVERYYPSDAALRSDVHLNVWFDALVRGIRHFVPDLTRDALTDLCVLLMYSASVGHTENSLLNYAVFLPTTVRLDGGQQSVGEVQNIVNFQLLIATPTSLLLNDVSHLALDEAAAGLMRQFRQDLLDFQEEMDAQPSQYWQLFPREIEAGVSC